MADYLDEIKRGVQVLEAAGLDPVEFAQRYSYLLSQVEYTYWQAYRRKHGDWNDELPWESE